MLYVKLYINSSFQRTTINTQSKSSSFAIIPLIGGFRKSHYLAESQDKYFSNRVLSIGCNLFVNLPNEYVGTFSFQNEIKHSQ